MTNDEKKVITQMREAGTGYARIAQETGISINTIKTFCRRNGLTGSSQETGRETAEGRCLQCRAPVEQRPGRKAKKFCSDACRNRWWNAHLNQVERKAFYSFTCAACGRLFESYGNSHRKYCCRACADRGRSHER